MTSRFVGGVELARDYYQRAVRVVLHAYRPGLPHTAALIGPGSEVLGFDTERSTDHDWGPRLLLFLRPGDRAGYGAELDRALARELPVTFGGHPTAFPMTHAPGPARHRVVITDLDTWFGGWLGFDPRRDVSLLDWLATPTQRLAEVTGGEVFHDGLGELTPARERLRWYPPDVWRYVLACQWRRVAQEEAFVGRCVEVGDAAGGAVVAARLVRDLMRLHLLMRHRYPPYAKWLGTALGRLPDGPALAGRLAAVLRADPATIGQRLCDAYADAAAAHNALGLTAPIDARPRPFHSRPYPVLEADRFVSALRLGVADPDVAALPLIGAVDQFVDSTDAVGEMSRCRAVARAALDLP